MNKLFNLKTVTKKLSLMIQVDFKNVLENNVLENNGKQKSCCLSGWVMNQYVFMISLPSFLSHV